MQPYIAAFAWDQHGRWVGPRDSRKLQARDEELAHVRAQFEDWCKGHVPWLLFQDVVLWREIEHLVETYLIPDLRPCAFYRDRLEEMFDRPLIFVEPRPNVPDDHWRLVQWAGNMFLENMSRLKKFKDLVCGELESPTASTGAAQDVTLALSATQACQEVISAMDRLGLEAKIPLCATYDPRPEQIGRLRQKK